MQIIIHTDDAKKLNSTILNSIKDKLETWEAKKDKNGFNIYYHSTKSKQWENELYIKPYIDNDRNEKLYFRITEIDGEKLDFENEFGYLMGRFMEILIVHFSNGYNKIEIK
jgi:hypothetical protein